MGGPYERSSPNKLWIEERWLDRQWILRLQELRQSLGLAVEKLSNPIDQGVEAKLWNTEDAASGSFEGDLLDEPD